MQYKKYEMNSFNLYTIKTDKFKNCHMEIIFRSKISEDTVTKRAFMNDLIGYTSKKHPTKQKVNIFLESMYNASFFNVTTRVGNALMANFVLDFLHPKYFEDESLENFLAIAFDFIFEPNIKDGAFDLNSYKIIKNRITADFETQKENAARYAIRRAIKNMDDKSVSSIVLPGRKEDLEDITREELVVEYKNMIDSDLCDIYIIGDLDMDEVATIIKDKCALRSVKNDSKDMFVENLCGKKIINIRESDNFAQSQLVMIFNATDFTKRERNTVIEVFNSIFGTAPISNKLAQSLREKNSLCYTVASIFQRMDSLLYVYAGIDEKNFDLATKLVKKALKEMVDGKFSDEDIEFAKLDLLTSLKFIEDNQHRLIDNYAFNTMTDRDLIQDEMKNLKTVTREEIIEVAKKIKLNTIYLLAAGGEDNEGN